MVEYEEITTVAERKTSYPERWVALPVLTLAAPGTSEYEQWMRKNWWMMEYSVFKDDKKEADRLAKELHKAFSEDPSHPSIPNLIEKLKLLRAKRPDERTPLEYWTHSAYQLADYCGGYDPYGAISKRLEKYLGEILEPMCGHSTYFGESPERNVTALDYCRTSLERYPFPKRRRIRCDLDQVGGDDRLPFSGAAFDAVSICFGFKYPKRIEGLVAEFRRVLKPSGILSFVENPGHGYQHLCQRRFVPMEVRKILSAQGFGTVSIEELNVPGWDVDSGGQFYHVEAVK